MKKVSSPIMIPILARQHLHQVGELRTLQYMAQFVHNSLCVKLTLAPFLCVI